MVLLRDKDCPTWFQSPQPLFQDDENKGKVTDLGDEVLEKARDFAETDEVLCCSWLIRNSNGMYEQSLSTAFLFYF